MNPSALFLLVPAAVAVSALATPAASAKTPQFSGFIKDWVIVGPFENPARSGPADRGAFDTDYLLPIGGEAKARLTEGTVVAGGSAKRVRIDGNTIDFLQHYQPSANKLVYAYAELDSPREQDALFLLGSDDGVKVFVNGEKAFEALPFPGRGYVARQDRFTVKLHKGVNTLLAKVENGTGAWTLGVETFAGKEKQAIEAAFQKAEDWREFQRLDVVPANGSYLIDPSETRFPKIVWRDVDRVRELVGGVPLSVRWFDKDRNEVTEPKGLGRYTAYVEGKGKDGLAVKRAVTFCRAPFAMVFSSDWGVELPYLGEPIDRAVWQREAELTSRAAGELVRISMIATDAGAAVLASLLDSKPSDAPAGVLDGSDVRHDDYQLALKLKLQGLAEKTRPLGPAKAVAGKPAPVLHAGTAAEAGMADTAKDRIDAVCRKWAEDSGEPFTILVARKGVIVTHEAFGKTADGTPLTTDFRHDVASITKAVSGILFGQFVDQGYVAIDDPIGKVLPGFPVKGDKTLTFRNLFTHTSGLQGHGEWGGIHNPYLDNVVLNGLDALEPGAAHNYNGMGYDLAAKAMENMSGKSIVRLFQENLFHPMGIGDVPIADMAYGANLTAYQLGALGQLLANHGRYGDKQFFTEATFNQMLPRNLKEFYPALDIEWGIGLTWFKETRAGSSAAANDLILGPRVIGHGSATSCVLRVDLDKGLVIAQVRATAGPKYDEYLTQFLTAVADSEI